MPLPTRVRALVIAVVVAAAGTAALSVRGASFPSVEDVAAALTLVVLVGAAHSFPVQLGPRVRVSADTAPAFAAVLLLPLPLAVAVSVFGIGAGEAARRRALLQAAYNVAVAALRAWAAGAALSLVLAGPLRSGMPAFRLAGALALAAAVMYLVNVCLIDAVVAVQRRSNPLHGWLGRRRAQAAHEGSLYLLGLLAAAAGGRWPGALLLLAVPSVVAYRSLRDGALIRVRTRSAVEEMADAIEGRDPFTAGHGRRAAELARALAVRAGLGAEEAERVSMAARVQNIGYAAAPASTARRSGALTEQEWVEIRLHPRVGAEMLARFPEHAAVTDLVLSHHERWDGRGYPSGLSGEAIPLGARVIAVADAFVAMTSPRPYRPTLTGPLVHEELMAGRGTQFDPRIVDALIDLIRDRPELAAPPAGAIQRSA